MLWDTLLETPKSVTRDHFNTLACCLCWVPPSTPCFASQLNKASSLSFSLFSFSLSSLALSFPLPVLKVGILEMMVALFPAERKGLLERKFILICPPSPCLSFCLSRSAAPGLQSRILNWNTLCFSDILGMRSPTNDFLLKLNDGSRISQVSSNLVTDARDGDLLSLASRVQIGDIDVCRDAPCQDCR